MGESYKDFHQRIKGHTSALSQWLSKVITFIVTTLIVLVVHRYFPSIVGETWIAPVVGLIVSGIVGYIGDLRRQLRVAWEDSNSRQETIEELKRLNAGTDLEPDCTFEVAIELVMELNPQRKYTVPQVEKLLFEKAFNKIITVWGKPVLTSSSRSYDDVNPVPIPHQFFFSPEPMASDGRGYGINVGIPQRGWNGWRGNNKYFFLEVNRRQIRGKFGPPGIMVV